MYISFLARRRTEPFIHRNWQGGYDAFSVNPSQIEIVSIYIQNQREHHVSKTFQEEYRAFIKKI
ncbi:hypothetical protein SAMN06265367_10965 [Algoriphagus winogradskyi]|uniref:Transposase n=1 Tax=Algoriphagus winogradskyi TaxID=237017 RepID=A0ABY1PHX3_9BACT|nr:hypothetical protein SAMN06265367_10965 [Algoriphagus winogradskyi]